MTTELRNDILDLSRQDNLGELTPWFSCTLDNYVQQGRYMNIDGLDQLGNAIIEDLTCYRRDNRIETVTLGMSGGVDSALTAALFKAAGWRVIGYTLPILQDPAETERGVEACNALGIEHFHIDLTHQYETMLVALSGHDQRPAESTKEASNIQRGNIRARLRMTTLYDQAHRYGGLVASTDNYSELAAGFWTLHGDVGDLAPIQSLLKSWEVPALSRAVGVPESTWRATPTDGLGISDGDEAQLGATYLQWDLMLLRLTEAAGNLPDGGSKDSLAQALEVDADPKAREVFEAVTSRMGRTWFKRAGTICLPHSVEPRFADLQELDRLLR
ncbi:NAD(+) synthase [Sulfitobacter sp. R18_1]|uniref:NAD(+) synthase n=1 Tax=Sulfitobacter sp. R18_1 TaxID=2821104 RepID=UPI001ADBF4EC|nr:NAD(+) synthase [Sulfitobacter sp. R18_1]MBO9428016.1 NAD(+) synthase [Sulfitobacter sp. R18_1]